MGNDFQNRKQLLANSPKGMFPTEEKLFLTDWKN